MKIKPMKGIAAAAAFFLLAACGQDAQTANDAIPEGAEMAAGGAAANRDWIPAGVILPQPHSVLQDTKIGTRTYLLQVSVPNDPSGKFAGWKDALVGAGYAVNDDSVLSDGRLLFDGKDVESGQIAVSQAEDVEGYMIQIDVSKNDQ